MEIVKRAHWDYVFVLKSKSKVIDKIFFWKSEIEALNKRMLLEYSLPQVLVYTDASNSGVVLGEHNLILVRWSSTRIGVNWRSLRVLLGVNLKGCPLPLGLLLHN